MAYGDDAGLAAWAAARGLTVTGTPAVLRQLGSDYLDGAYEGLWSGYRTDPFGQENAWPRTGATLNCVTAIPSDLIPLAVINASYRAAYLESVTPGVLTGPVQSGARVKRERVEGAVEIEYMDDGAVLAGSASGFVDPSIDGAMGQFICDAGENGFFFQSIGI